MGIYGQDWASYQSSTPDTSGLSFAFVKVTEGLSYINPSWVSQRDHAKANGLVWGGYHYPNMGNSVQAEANYFINQVNWRPGDIVILDWEGYDAANSRVAKSTQRAYKEAWLRYVKGRLPHNPVGLYANLDYWWNVDQDGYYADFLWIATAGRAAGSPGIQANWLFHQYGESNGLDRDYCRLGSTSELRTWALSFQPPPPQETDMPQWITGRVDAGTQPTVVLLPHGTAWAGFNRRLHLGMDQITDVPAVGSVRVALHNGTGWRDIQAVQVEAAGGAVDVDITSGDVKLSLQTETAGVTYAVETW
ncbi:glycoside hydrolase family 25 protein [Streptomyces xanthochromogenes]|uniref:glycoside hydrolase family 25 protein n=1 Tax=Streptomyces xanthochromogenes TaxID=67384 RepID=UPI0034192DF5